MGFSGTTLKNIFSDTFKIYRNQNLKCLCLRGHYQESEKANQRLTKYICDACNPTGSVSRIYKEFLQTSEMNSPIIKTGKVSEQHFKRECPNGQ